MQFDQKNTSQLFEKTESQKSSRTRVRRKKLVIPSHQCAMFGNPHDIISFSGHTIIDRSHQIKAFYEQGLSLREIECQIGISKTKIRKVLLKMGVVLRNRHDGNGYLAWRKSGKGNVKPPYGFCYFEGRLVKDPKEYTVLSMIYERWKLGQNPNSIAETLNRKRIPSPMKKEWSWNSVVNIVNRFKTGTIAIGKDGLELTKLI